MCFRAISCVPVPLEGQNNQQPYTVVLTYNPRPACGNLLSQVGNLSYKLHSLLAKLSLEAFHK